MSDDLISRKALMVEIANIFSIPILKMNLRPEHMTIIKIEEIIKNMPTAFDKEKVIEQIKNERDEAKEYKQESAMIVHEIDIEIVGKGGLD